MLGDEMRKVLFGKGGPHVSRVGLGGEGILRSWGRGVQAKVVIGEALAQGITYYDSARAYAGSESYYGSVWSDTQGIRSGIFQASKSASRDQEGARRDLETTLRNMCIEYLDLWQIHDVRTHQDIKAIEANGGALKAFEKAKLEGKVRFIGVTAHHDPKVLEKAVQTWPVDAVMIPVNPVEAVMGGFLQEVVLMALERKMAVIGMKVLGGSHFLNPGAGVTARRLIRYALAQPVTLVVVGCSNPEEVRTLADLGKEQDPMGLEEQNELLELFRPLARRLAYYRGDS